MAGCIIVVNYDDMCFSLQFTCTSGFFEVFSLPIWIISLGSVWGAAILQLQRSDLSQKAFALTIQNNLFTNRIKLKEEFSEYVSGLMAIKVKQVHNIPFEVSINDKYEHFSLYYPCWGNSTFEVTEENISKVKARFFRKLNSLATLMGQAEGAPKDKGELLQTALSDIGMNLTLVGGSIPLKIDIHSWREVLAVSQSAVDLILDVERFMMPKRSFDQTISVTRSQLPKIFQLIDAGPKILLDKHPYEKTTDKS